MLAGAAARSPRRPRPHFHDDYVYFSSYSTSWLDHARRYVETMTARFDPVVLEPGHGDPPSNDGYLLQYFHQNGVPCPGAWNRPPIPAPSGACQGHRQPRAVLRQADRARAVRGRLAGGSAARLANVLAHVPISTTSWAALPIVLKPEGVVTLSFRTACLLDENQFDTLYHEHYSYCR